MKERQVSNRRKHSSGVSGLGSCARGQRAKSRVTDLLVCLGLVAVTWAVFGQTLAHDFVNFDDHVYVYENPLVIRGLSAEGIIGAFTHTHARNWHPLTTLSHMLDCQLYGLNAGGHHLTNVILHTISVLLLFLVLKQMTGAFWQSAFVAALFAIHPLHVESVAWIAERKDVLSAVFFHADAGRVCSLCAGALRSSISARSAAFRFWADVETHARNAAVRAVAVGLLASR